MVTGRSNALSYLKGKLATITDTYTLAIVTYALQLANDPAKEIALNKLVKLAVTEGEQMLNACSSHQDRRPYYTVWQTEEQ